MWSITSTIHFLDHDLVLKTENHPTYKAAMDDTVHQYAKKHNMTFDDAEIELVRIELMFRLDEVIMKDGVVIEDPSLFE